MNNGKTAVPSGIPCLHFPFFSSCHRDDGWTAYAFAHT